MSGHARDLMTSVEFRWPTGHTTAELDAVELEPVELDALGAMLRRGRSWVFNHYRRTLRAAGLSWIGIPTAELASAVAQTRMARVLILIARPKVEPAFTFRLPCNVVSRPLDGDGMAAWLMDLECEEEHGGHEVTLTLE